MTILIAPDKFKGTLTAPEVAAAIAGGLDGPTDICPIADGGDGTAAVLCAADGGRWVSARAHDALGTGIEARFALLGSGREAVVDVAEASGLARLAGHPPRPLEAGSEGTGELIAAAIAAGAERVLIACGGSASTDAGLGALSRFDPAAAELVCLCDVNDPFLGALRYAPQKGAGEAELRRLESRLRRIAGELPHDPTPLPFTGAAGGLAGGFWAHGARLVAGAAFVLDRLEFDRRLAAASAVITGEGRLDETSLSGKAVGEVSRRAARAGIPCHAIVGGSSLRGADSRFASVRIAGAPEEITAAARELATAPLWTANAGSRIVAAVQGVPRKERDLVLKRLLGSVAVLFCLLLMQASGAGAKDYADVARNIVPSGQYGSLPVPPNADEQAIMYDSLTPLFDEVTNPDLNNFFKSEVLNSVGPDGPTTTEDVSRPGVTVVRDRFGVPHVTADTKDDGVWTAGYLLAEDRGLLLEQARYNARVAAVDVPGITALGLITSLSNFVPSAKTERVVAKQTDVLKKAGREGKAVLHDIDVFIKGINAYLEANSPDTEPWTRNDVYAVNALKGQFLGEGGGEEAERSQFLDGLQDRLGSRKGMNIFNDLRQFRNQDAPTTVDGKFKYGKIPNKAPGSVVIDHGSYTPDPAISSRAEAERLNTESVNASNTLQINADRSDKGIPLMVGGPQIGYFYPGFTYEIDMDAGKMKWRGVTSAPFPGYLLIGRGEDFAVTLTSASADIIDQYVETLCGGSDTRYRYKGKCRDMKKFDAGTLNGEKVEFMTTKHGPVVAYATVDGRRVAISERRSSYGRDVRDQLFFRRLSIGKVDSVKSFYKAANKTPQTFNSFYMDNEDNAMFTSGRLPKRPRGTDPGLPTDGRGNYEWNGFAGKKVHPKGKNPKSGAMVNWNNNVAKGFGAADDQWGRAGSAARNDLLTRNLRKFEQGGRWDLLAVTSAMNAAATQDIRAIDTVPLLARLLDGTRPPNPQAAQMLSVMKDWRAQGGSRLDVDLDGKIDHPGAASMDGAWDLIADALMKRRIGPQLDELASLFSRFDQPPGGQYNGWYQYAERDLKKLLGDKIKAPFKVDYCGKGDLNRCQDDVWAAIAEAGAELEKQYGSANPAEWFADATAERISFAPGLLTTTMRYTNRPSGIQQVISFTGSR